ncbi:MULTISPECIES: YfbM family protein [unclassified Streptomyces]|uniref:YfbM family protein n=1 Tax=unclassified Streptomyces TaxID=2593676 RepID=UPI001CBDF89A|nr:MULTISPECIES: YfbM family protein [unclassified Streptomyces]WPO69158.1 YfbM family protein [Streptomyces sp. KN37]
MAVTQQLARIPEGYLAACRQSAAASPDGDPHWDPPAYDVLDLDWAPALLKRVGEVAGLKGSHLDALRRATDGDTALDLGFLDTHPHVIAPFGGAPTSLDVSQVECVSELLGQIDMPILLAALPTDERDAASLIDQVGSIAGGLRAYLLVHFNALRDFYLDAAKRHLHVVIWWD